MFLVQFFVFLLISVPILFITFQASDHKTTHLITYFEAVIILSMGYLREPEMTTFTVRFHENTIEINSTVRIWATPKMYNFHNMRGHIFVMNRYNDVISAKYDDVISAKYDVNNGFGDSTLLTVYVPETNMST